MERSRAEPSPITVPVTHLPPSVRSKLCRSDQPSAPDPTGSSAPTFATPGPASADRRNQPAPGRGRAAGRACPEGRPGTARAPPAASAPRLRSPCRREAAAGSPGCPLGAPRSSARVVLPEAHLAGERSRPRWSSPKRGEWAGGTRLARHGAAPGRPAKGQSLVASAARAPRLPPRRGNAVPVLAPTGRPRLRASRRSLAAGCHFPPFPRSARSGNPEGFPGREVTVAAPRAKNALDPVRGGGGCRLRAPAGRGRPLPQPICPGKLYRGRGSNTGNKKSPTNSKTKGKTNKQAKNPQNQNHQDLQILNNNNR